MEANSNFLKKAFEKKIFWATAFLFPILMFIGFSRTYYLGYFFDAPALTNAIVHTHGIVMSLWVLFFCVQIALVRTRNIKVHMTLGMFGVFLAVVVVISSLVTAYDSLLVRGVPIDGLSPHSFLIIPFTSLMVFVILFIAAIYYRKRPTEHKSLMFLTAVNFLPFAFSRMPFIPPEIQIPWAFGGPDLIAIAVFVWFSIKQKKINKVFAAGLFLMIASQPLRIALMESPLWLNLVALVAP
ncbi:MAG: hypothetical protein R2681_03415 [Pyrinomonadaceae bacterium]